MDWKKAPAAIFGDAATAFAIGHNGGFTSAREILLAKTGMKEVEDRNFSCIRTRSAIRPIFNGNKVSFGVLDQEIGELAMNPDVIGRNAPLILAEITRESLDLAGRSLANIDSWVPHQAGRDILERFCNIAAVSPDKVVQNFKTVGNLTSSSIPYALAERWEELTGETVACPSVGAGPNGAPWMSSGMVLLGNFVD
jgi:3-oxoacyl-[acyl-carrier-protein] synthase III